MIKFGEWTPDQSPLSGGLATAKNCYSNGDSYRSFPSLTPFSSAITARCQGFVHTKSNDGTVRNFAGDATKLYELSGTTYADKSKVGGYTTGSEERWNFVRWGNTLIATNYSDAIQSITLGGAVFADLSATAPRARYLAVVRDFLMAGYTYDATDGSKPNRVRWAGIDSSTAWTIDAATQADINDFQNGGAVTGVVGGEFAIVFGEESIHRLTYVGPKTIFQSDRIDKSIGTVIPGSIVENGSNVFFIGPNGFYVTNGSGAATLISSNKVSKTFFAEVDQSYLYRITSVVDPINSLIIWSYPGDESVSGTPNRLLIYNYVDNRFTYADATIETLGRSISAGLTLEQLDSYGTLETLPYSLDSGAWQGGSISLAAFDTAHKLNTFDGAPTQAVFETNDFTTERTHLNGIRPLITGGTYEVEVGGRNELSDVVTWKPATGVNASGIAPCRINQRYTRARITVTGTFNHAIGIEPINAQKAGNR